MLNGGGGERSCFHKHRTTDEPVSFQLSLFIQSWKAINEDCSLHIAPLTIKTTIFELLSCFPAKNWTCVVVWHWWNWHQHISAAKKKHWGRNKTLQLSPCSSNWSSLTLACWFLVLFKCWSLTSPPLRLLSFTAESDRDKRDWMEALQEAIAETLSDYEVAEKIWSNRSNRMCADCKALNPDWASINLCVVICKNCAGTWCSDHSMD